VRRPFTGGGTRPGRYRASAIYRGRYPPGEVPCVGHLPGEVPARGGTVRQPFTGGGTPRGRVHASATFTGAEGIPGGRYHTSAIYRKVDPWREVPYVGHLPESGSRQEGACIGHLPEKASWREVPCVGHLPERVSRQEGACVGHVIRAPARTGPSSWAPASPRSIARAPPPRLLVLAHMWEGWLPHLKGSITAGAERGRCRGANLPVS
jgi:hypothetical protein